jgi:hypothetical protein
MHLTIRLGFFGPSRRFNAEQHALPAPITNRIRTTHHVAIPAEPVIDVAGCIRSEVELPLYQSTIKREVYGPTVQSVYVNGPRSAALVAYDGKILEEDLPALPL